MPQTDGLKECQCTKPRKPLHWKRSPRYPVDAVEDTAADTREEGSKECRSVEIHCGGGAPVLGEYARFTPPSSMVLSWDMTRRYGGASING